MSSIRKRLLTGVVLIDLFALLVGSVSSYWVVREEASDLIDYHLRQIALTAGQSSGLGHDIHALMADTDPDFVVQIRDRKSGALVVDSRKQARIIPIGKEGFSTIELPSGVWRCYSHPTPQHLVQICHPREMRDSLAASLAIRALIPLLLVLAAVTVAMWWLVGRGLRPIDRLVRQVGAQSAQSLQKLPATNGSAELEPLVHALNDLLERLGRAISVQRNFVADAAHSLRTPLTALQLQVQLAEQATTDADREASLRLVRQGLGRAARVVGQLLSLARSEADASERVPSSMVDLSLLVKQVMADLAPLAESKAIDLGASTFEDAIFVAGHRAQLAILLANVFDNALNYTPNGGIVDVSLQRDSRCSRLLIADSGPGIPQEYRARAFDRFYRRAVSEETSGTGLGLAIVKAVADQHHAHIVLGDSVFGGLAFCVEFPAVAASA